MVAAGIRNAGVEDAAALGACHAASWRETYAGLLPASAVSAMSAEACTAMWRRVLGGSEATAVLVAVDGDRLVGFGGCAEQRDPALATRGFTGEIGALYVQRTHQRRGLGRALTAGLARALHDGGHAAASLWVLDGNARARAFYAQIGGVVIGARTEDHLGTPLVERAYGWPDVARLFA